MTDTASHLWRSDNSSTGYVGVRQVSSGRYECTYRSQHLGTFDTVGTAAAAYAKHHGMTELESFVPMKSNTNSSGYVGVRQVSSGRYQCESRRQHLGTFDTAEAAAVAYAKHNRATELGLFVTGESHRSNTGFAGVRQVSSGRYECTYRSQHVGTFDTVEAAAAAYAKHQKAAAAYAHKAKHAVAPTGALAILAPADLSAWRSETAQSGYKGVYMDRHDKFRAEIRRNGTQMRLGIFATIAEAATAVANAAKETIDWQVHAPPPLVRANWWCAVGVRS